MIIIKRIYDPPKPNDGYRILIDGLWPRGVSKQRAEIDLWLKEIAPSKDLRRWFGHKPERWEKFKQNYFKELSENPALQTLKQAADQNNKVTLLYGAKDQKHNNAVALKMYLQNHNTAAKA